MGEKMIAVLQIFMLSDHKYLSSKEIIEQLKDFHIYVERKHIYTIFDQINSFFYPVFHDNIIKSLKKRGSYLDVDYFHDGELQFLLDNITYHEDLNDEDKRQLKNKLLCLSSSLQQQRLIDNNTAYKPQTFSLLINLTVIMKAIEKKMMLSFQYINYEIKNYHLVEISSTHGNNQTKYELSPYQIVSSNNHYYVIGYNQIHQEGLSIYHIDRMRSIQTIKNAYIDMTDQFDIHAQIAKMTNMYTTTTYATLKIECDKRILREIASHFGKDIYIEETHYGRCLVIIEETSISEGLIGWLMMLQNQVKVIAPVSLKDEIVKRIQLMMEQYEE